ncbi:MAG: HDOD domain-containing protein [Syntrophobacteraceae bacterium]|nr:HDOD domain-containing protein [Syntrophobacteraceae bacterium]
MSTMAFDKEIYNRVSKVKLLPALVNSKRMLKIIYDQTCAVKELESIIGYDCSLAANLVLTGNTSSYGHRGEVSTLSKAITVLGLDQVRWVCLFSLMTDWLPNECVIGEAHRERLWKHSFVASKIAVEISGHRPWMNVEEAFLLGLTYDIGWQIMAVCFRSQFEDILKTAARNKVPPWWIEARYGMSHTQIAFYLGAQRALPECFQAVAAFHHIPEKSSSFKTEVTLISLVDVLAHAREHPEAMNEELTLSRCKRLNICEDEWSGYQQRLDRIWFEADHLWRMLQ